MAGETNGPVTDWQVRYSTLPSFEVAQAWEVTGTSDFRQARLGDDRELTFWGASPEHDSEKLRDLDFALQHSDRHPGSMQRAFPFYAAVLAGEDYVKKVEDLVPPPDNFLAGLREKQADLRGIAMSAYKSEANELDIIARGATHWVLLGRGRGADIGGSLRRAKAAQLRGVKLCFDDKWQEPIAHPVLQGKDGSLSVWHDTARLFIGPSYEI